MQDIEERVEVTGELARILASPCHQAPLLDQEDGGGQAVACALCGRHFTRRDGVYDLRLSRDTGDAAVSFDYQWRRYHRGEFERETLYGADARAELAGFLAAFGCQTADLRGRWILDAGCGSGRLARSLAGLGANVIALDVADAIRLAAAGNSIANLLFVQADLMHPPLMPESFDFVWSVGVLHHTGVAARAFQRLAALVAPGGRMAVWLYSARRFSPFLAARRLMPFAQRMPEERIMRLCRVLAVPLFMAGAAAPLIGRRPRRLATIRFGLYDALSPRYQSRHTVGQVQAWFSAGGFSHLRVWSEVGVSGVRG